jgi:hypothetical protein
MPYDEVGNSQIYRGEQMSKKKTEDRPYMGMGVFNPGDCAAPGNTIVGGQPDGQRRKGVVSVPVGLEQLLLTAAVDPAFREALIRDRERAVSSRGLRLTQSEISVLRITPESQLETMIDHIDTSEKNLEKRSFMRTVAATVLTLAAGTSLQACGGTDETKGTGAPFKGDSQQVDVPRPDPMPPTGVRPDVIPPSEPTMAGAEAQEPDASAPSIEILNEDIRPTKGIRPDLPEALKPKPRPEPKVDVTPPKSPTRGHTKY